MQKREEELINYLVKEKIEELGGFVVDVMIGKSKIVIEIDKMNGLTIDDCASVSRHLHAGFEESGLLESYEVEVSSPGTSNAFKVLDQYKKYLGWEVKVITKESKDINGVLELVDEDKITIKEVIAERINKKKTIREELSEVPLMEIKETKLVLKTKK